MDHFAGLDVSVKETSVCIVDETGKIVREVKVVSECGPAGMSAIAPLTGGKRKWREIRHGWAGARKCNCGRSGPGVSSVQTDP